MNRFHRLIRNFNRLDVDAQVLLKGEQKRILREITDPKERAEITEQAESFNL
jgi:hypothetical protein